MRLTSDFHVPSAPDKVLALLLDAATMQACIPGCEELVQRDDTHYRGVLVNEVAHVRFKAGFTAEITSTSAPDRTEEPAVVRAVLKGEDRRLGSTIRVDATLTVRSDSAGGNADASRIEYVLELAMWGKLGRLGESVIRRRSMEVERQFVESFSAVCAGQPLPRQEVPDVRPAAASVPRASGAAQTAGAHVAVAGVTEQPPEPTRGREDWVILGLAAAAAFAYGVIVGGRGGRRR
ncbi:MAG TPA: SRPBCC domain-containing protein [Nocardioidaceae bacterium]|nr:SRPBCC domain-containing protein [Nocardioidaceae bacterium]